MMLIGQVTRNELVSSVCALPSSLSCLALHSASLLLLILPFLVVLPFPHTRASSSLALPVISSPFTQPLPRLHTDRNSQMYGSTLDFPGLTSRTMMWTSPGTPKPVSPSWGVLAESRLCVLLTVAPTSVSSKCTSYFSAHTLRSFSTPFFSLTAYCKEGCLWYLQKISTVWPLVTTSFAISFSQAFVTVTCFVAVASWLLFLLLVPHSLFFI